MPQQTIDFQTEYVDPVSHLEALKNTAGFEQS